MVATVLQLIHTVGTQLKRGVVQAENASLSYR